MDAQTNSDLRTKALNELRRQIEQGLQQLDQGQAAPLDMESIKQRGRERLAERHKADNQNS